MGLKKAISPIIAIIIILLITIAIAGAGFSYISTYWTSLTGKQIQILSTFCVQTGHQGKVLIRNIGTASFDTSDEITVVDARTGEDLSNDVLWSSSVADSSNALELRFDEGSGTKAIDTSGKGNDGTLKNGTGDPCFTNGACPDYADGRIGSTLEFDGDGDYVGISAYSLGFKGFATMSVSAYIKTSTLSGNGIIAGSSSGGNWNWQLERRGNQIRFEVRTAGGYKHVFSTGTIPVDTWLHVAGVYDGANVKVYVDNVRTVVKQEILQVMIILSGLVLEVVEV